MPAAPPDLPIEDVDAALAAPEPLAAVLDLVIERFRSHSGSIHLCGADGALRLEAARHLPEHVLRLIAVIPVGRGMAGLAVERAAPVTACNLVEDRTGDVRPGAKQAGLRGSIVVPILRAGRAVGALGIADRDERTFTEAETGLLMAVGRRIGEHTAG